MSLPRYPRYKDTGVMWLGDVPEHWHTCSLKRVVKLQSGDSITGESIEEQGAYPVYGGNGSRGYTTSFTHEGYFALIGRQGALCGNVNYANGKFWASEHAVVVTPIKPVSTVWLGELLRTMNLNQYSVAAAQPGLSVDIISNLRIPLPSLEEQYCIATFLGRETSKIDALISAQETLITLLAEKRQATISHAVTKGLNPNTPMKDSGVEWLAEVPEHWAVARLGYFATVENGTTPRRDLSEYWDGGDVPWLASGEVNQTHIYEAAEFITAQALSECSLRILPVGTIVIGMIGQGKTRGMSAMLHIAATINQNLAAICPGPKIHGKYLLYIFNVVYEWLREAGRGGNQAAMNCQILSALRVSLPPVNEQVEIAGYIDKKLEEMQSLSTEAEKAIALLNERRTALISAAVTGKIDVRQTVQQKQSTIQEAA